MVEKNVSFDLKNIEIREYEKETIDYFEDYYSSINKYLNYDKKEEIKNNEIDCINLRKGKKIKKE